MANANNKPVWIDSWANRGTVVCCGQKANEGNKISNQRGRKNTLKWRKGTHSVDRSNDSSPRRRCSPQPYQSTNSKASITQRENSTTHKRQLWTFTLCVFVRKANRVLAVLVSFWLCVLLLASLCFKSDLWRESEKGSVCCVDKDALKQIRRWYVYLRAKRVCCVKSALTECRVIFCTTTR